MKLSDHAPLMTEEQKLSRFILGLEGQLAEETNALCPTFLADALIRAKAKHASFASGERKRSYPFLSSGSFRPHKTAIPDKTDARPTPSSAPRQFIRAVKVNALPINQSGRKNQCYNCKKWGHKQAECPDKVKGKPSGRPALPPQ